MTRIVFILVAFLYIEEVLAQDFGLGASAMYNPQTESFGFGVRAEFPRNRMSIVPQIAYYPGFNKINEYYLGVGFNYNLFSLKRWTLYAIIHPGYNGWINYEFSAKKDARYSNFDLEGGIGIKTGRCFKPFIEYRYNIHWKETNAQLGFVYFFGCKKGKGYGSGYGGGGKGGGKRSKRGNCNAYD